MNRIESLGTARIALSAAMVMVFAAILVPLPRPPRPVVASRPAGAKEERKRLISPVHPGVPSAATAPRLAARDDGRTAGDVPPRTALRDSQPPAVKATPLHPIAEETPRETLPPHPREVTSPAEEFRRAPKADASPFEDPRSSRKPLRSAAPPLPEQVTAPAKAPVASKPPAFDKGASPEKAPAAEVPFGSERPTAAGKAPIIADKASLIEKAPVADKAPIADKAPASETLPGTASPRKTVSPEDRMVHVNVVLNRDTVPAPAAPSNDAETVARLEARLEALQQRLDEIARLKAGQQTEESRQTTKLLERVEHMVSMSEMQRKIDALQLTIEETKRAQAHFEQGRRTADVPAAPATTVEPEAATTAPAETVARPSAAPATVATQPEAASRVDSGLPEIRPGPPFFPRPDAASARDNNVRLDQMRQAFGPSSPAPKVAPQSLVLPEGANAATPITQAIKRNGGESPVASEPVELEPEEEPADLSGDPAARESSCYEYQLALRCVSRGELLQARTHIRRSIAFDPSLQAPRKLSEQIDERIRGTHRAGRPINGSAPPVPPGRTFVQFPVDVPNTGAKPAPAIVPAKPAAPAVPSGTPFTPTDNTLHPNDAVPESEASAATSPMPASTNMP